MKVFWFAEPEGFYSVQSAYKMVQGPTLGTPDSIFKPVWVKAAPSNVCGFIWKAMQDRLPTRVNLLRRKVILNTADACCPLCVQEEETLDHLIITCSIAVKVWEKCYKWLNMILALPKGCRNHMQQYNRLQSIALNKVQ